MKTILKQKITLIGFVTFVVVNGLLFLLWGLLLGNYSGLAWVFFNIAIYQIAWLANIVGETGFIDLTAGSSDGFPTPNILAVLLIIISTSISLKIYSFLRPEEK
ncbi:MAG: hypothetical protein MN733_15170 [Nitrososphaera sp.]|nr:hypothetical protein [Nitrososphaera sp.]